MLQLGIKEFKASFFDSGEIQKRVNAATRKTLSKIGAFIRTRAKTSIRKRKKISEPGQPPSSHEGSLRRLIFFGYDKTTQSVVVGPAAFREGTAPRLLEFGGSRQTTAKSGAAKVLVYRPRPFMRPAGEAEAVRGRLMLKGMVNG